MLFHIVAGEAKTSDEFFAQRCGSGCFIPNYRQRRITARSEWPAKNKAGDIAMHGGHHLVHELSPDLCGNYVTEDYAVEPGRIEHCNGIIDIGDSDYGVAGFFEYVSAKKKQFRFGTDREKKSQDAS
jgi:hypothetical protein